MNDVLRKLLALLAAGAVAVVAFAASLALHLGFMIVDHPVIPTGVTLVALVASFVLTLRFVRRRLSLNTWSLSSPTALVVLGLFLVTWAFGAPKVQTDLAAEEIATYKQLKERKDRVWEAHPRIRFVVSVPIAPAVLLTYHEYQLAGLYGEGRWDVHFWYGAGTIQLLGITTWIS